MKEAPLDGMFPYKISFADCPPSDAVTATIEKHLEKVARHFDRVSSCRVTVRIPNKHHLKRFYHIHILLDIPGKTLVVGREPERDEAHMDINIAISDAFDKLLRQLEDFRDARTLGRRRSEPARVT